MVSAAGHAHAPRLRPEDLRTAVQETVTAPAHARRHRRQVQRWQLGFDLLQREARGVDAYLPLPPIDAAALAGSFAGWCRALAQQRQIARSDSMYSRTRGTGAVHGTLKRRSLCPFTCTPSPSVKRPFE